MAGATTAHAFCKMASRARETYTFEKWRSSTSVSSTRNAHFQNQVSSRLRETLLFMKKCCLVYAKPPLWEATLSRVHPSPALLSQVEHGKSRVSSTRNACLQKTLNKSRLSSTRNTHFQMQVSSRLRETVLFLKNCCLVYAKPPLWEAALSCVQPSPALLSQLEHGKSRVSSTQNACLQKTKKSPLAYAKRTLPNASVVSSTRDGTFVF